MVSVRKNAHREKANVKQFGGVVIILKEMLQYLEYLLANAGFLMFLQEPNTFDASQCNS